VIPPVSGDALALEAGAVLFTLGPPRRVGEGKPFGCYACSVMAGWLVSDACHQGRELAGCIREEVFVAKHSYVRALGESPFTYMLVPWDAMCGWASSHGMFNEFRHIRLRVFWVEAIPEKLPVGTSQSEAQSGVLFQLQGTHVKKVE
jgi:hypothetical protein